MLRKCFKTLKELQYFTDTRELFVHDVYTEDKNLQDLFIRFILCEGEYKDFLSSYLNLRCYIQSNPDTFCQYMREFKQTFPYWKIKPIHNLYIIYTLLVAALESSKSITVNGEKITSVFTNALNMFNHTSDIYNVFAVLNAELVSNHVLSDNEIICVEDESMIDFNSLIIYFFIYANMVFEGFVTDKKYNLEDALLTVIQLNQGQGCNIAISTSQDLKEKLSTKEGTESVLKILDDGYKINSVSLDGAFEVYQIAKLVAVEGKETCMENKKFTIPQDKERGKTTYQEKDLATMDVQYAFQPILDEEGRIKRFLVINVSLGMCTVTLEDYNIGLTTVLTFYFDYTDNDTSKDNINLAGYVCRLATLNHLNKFMSTN